MSAPIAREPPGQNTYMFVPRATLHSELFAKDHPDRYRLAAGDAAVELLA